MQGSVYNSISLVEINDRSDLSIGIDVCVSVHSYMSVKKTEGHKLYYEYELMWPGGLM